ncbi:MULTISPECIES: hypothetical protein [unclassified Xanthobacter]|uniref:hypothetical protein n=1 Tax=unclassified Xanthobacter TaxID=2623496 RepID=UPI001EDE9F9F|nr:MULTISPECIES: hypothetical protein [unclassified Xanthobacter]
MVVGSPLRSGLDMTRATVSLIAVFALIAAACVAFGTYFANATLSGAYGTAVEARFKVTATRISSIIERAASLGIAVPVQRTLTEVLRREARLEADLISIDIADERGAIVFSSAPERVGQVADAAAPHQVVSLVRNDFDAIIGRVIMRYDPRALAMVADEIHGALWAVAWPTLAGAVVATILVGAVLAGALRRAVRRAAHPSRWPGAARAVLAEIEGVHRDAQAPGAAGGGR